jgi:hypothetical protein
VNRSALIELCMDLAAERVRRDRGISVEWLDAEALAWVSSRFKDEE